MPDDKPSGIETSYCSKGRAVKSPVPPACPQHSRPGKPGCRGKGGHRGWYTDPLGVEVAGWRTALSEAGNEPWGPSLFPGHP